MQRGMRPSHNPSFSVSPLRKPTIPHIDKIKSNYEDFQAYIQKTENEFET